MRALKELLSSWRANPDATATIALCSYLGVHHREDLIQEVAASAEAWHAEDPEVMLAVGRMYLDAGMLGEAQASLVTAGKLGGRDPKAFRYLGEVLLRRGDAVRGEKALARAQQLGMHDDETRLWHERAVVYTALQKRIGAKAVALEVARAIPQTTSIPPPEMPTSSPGFPDEVTLPRSSGLQPSTDAVRLSSRDVVSADPVRVSDADFISAEPIRISDEGMISEDPLRVSDSEILEEHDLRIAGVPAGAVTRARANFPLAQAPRVTAARARSNPPPTSAAAALSAQALYEDITDVKEPASAEHAAFLRTEPGIAQPAHSTPIAASPSKSTHRGLAPPPPTSWPETVPAPPSRAPSLPSYRGAQRVSSLLDAVDDLETARDVPHVMSEPAAVAPRVVLQHLARVGIFEPGLGAEARWERAPRQKSRGLLTLTSVTLLLAALGVGAWNYAKRIKAERISRARDLTVQVDRMLHSGNPQELAATDDKLSQAFELDSLSRKAARLWLENRVLGLLLISEQRRGIDSAVQRGQSVGLEEKQLAFGRIAGYFAEGDLAGGAALLPRWDKAAGRDAHYQLVAAALLERAGDARALERYEAARGLDPALVPAHMLLARMLLLEFGVERGAPVVQELANKIGDQPMLRGLRALSWVVDPNRPSDLPPEAALSPQLAEKLPAPLRAVPAMVDAVKAMQNREFEAASRAIDSALLLSNDPGLASGLGFLAIEAGNEELARKAALRALSFAAVYPRARVLAARVALLGGRSDEAERAIEGLEPTAPNHALVRAVVAYEALGYADLRALLEASGEAKNQPSYSALLLGAEVAGGLRRPSAVELERLAQPSIPWGEIVAIDAALINGNLDLPEKILARHAIESASPAYLQRLARLRRYQGKVDEAEHASAAAMQRGNLRPALLIERVYDLIDKGDSAAARDVIAKYPNVLGPMTVWLSALVDVAAKQAAQAVVRLVTQELPPPETPLEYRLMVARALAAAKDSRARAYVTAVARVVPRHPEIYIAAKAL